MSGQRLASKAPYGYIKGEDGQLLVDEETAPVVELIFQLCVEGNGPGKIARMLKEREIPTPGTIEFRRTGRTSRYYPDDPCRWNPATVLSILDQDTYLGRTTNFKTTKLSYKSKKAIINPPDKRAVFEGTHKAIIDRETWEIVQKNREQRRRPTKLGEMGLFSGLAYCADCGAKLYHHRTVTFTKEQESYTCANYRSRKQCTAHYIRAVVLEELVLQNLQRVVAYAQDDEDEFVRRVMENKTAAQRTEQERAKRKLEKQERRISELDRIIQQLYEDRVSGALSAERFAKLSGGYEKEQKELKQSAKELQAIVNTIETQAVNVQSFLKIVRKYTAPTELTPALLREFVEKIVVHAPDKSTGDRVQEVDIYLKFIGKFDAPMPEPTPEEIAEQERLQKERIRSRERYRRLKAGENLSPPFERICEQCGKTFMAGIPNAKFCHPNCRAKFYCRQAAESRRRDCTCANCGKVFSTTRTDVKYCSDDCRVEANRIMQKQRNAKKRDMSNEKTA